MVSTTSREGYLGLHVEYRRPQVQVETVTKFFLLQPNEKARGVPTTRLLISEGYITKDRRGCS